MENNVISMFMDVKIDLRDHKGAELFRNWTNCSVKIETVKSFLSFIRITFTKEPGSGRDSEIAHQFSISINIPGVSVRCATSRTKAHSYGLFWKQTRKRCCIFFAFESKLTCERHMRWVKKSIKNLELHRQEMLESKRASRSSFDSKNTEETDQTANMKKSLKISGDKRKNLQHILGPLPKIPDFNDIEWSRRISTVSGIYEEIKDPENSRQQPRISVASGIYEEMKPPSNFQTIREQILATPPPLPPRKRVNTFRCDVEGGRIPRSYTNPETNLCKKRNYLSVIETVFGRKKRSESVSEDKVSSPGNLLQKSPSKEFLAANKTSYDTVTSRKKIKSKILLFTEMINKRNSFSSPDLSKYKEFDVFDALDDLSSLSSDLQICDIGEASSSNEFLPRIPISIENLNISEKIQSNFNFSCNSSTINLVGANLNGTKSDDSPLHPPAGYSSSSTLDDLSGYCVMAPIKRDLQSHCISVTADSDKENEEVLPLLPRNTIYENMTLNQPENRSSANFYENFESKNMTNQILNEINSSTESNSDIPINTSRRSTSIDDKVPSYYPNSCSDSEKNRRQRLYSTNSDKDTSRTITNTPSKHSISRMKANRKENLYISTPQKINDEHKNKLLSYKLSSANPQDQQNDENIILISIKTPETPSPQKKEENEIIFKDEKSSNSKLYQKYATLHARFSPKKYMEKCSNIKKSPTPSAATATIDFGNLKKFASLPRFKKIDFSPLKIKISSVLQRHQTDGY